MMIHKLRPYTYNKALAHPQQCTQQWQLPSAMATHTTHYRPHHNFTIWLECLIVLQTMDTNFSFNYGRFNYSLHLKLWLQRAKPRLDLLASHIRQAAQQHKLDSWSLLMVTKLFRYHIINRIYFARINLK